jgi:hypothetical protein
MQLEQSWKYFRLLIEIFESLDLKKLYVLSKKMLYIVIGPERILD